MSIDKLAYFGLGFAAGAVAAVFLNPKSGPETRRFLTSKAAEGTDYATSRVMDVHGAASRAVKRAEKAVRQQTENIAAAVDAGVETYREAVRTTP